MSRRLSIPTVALTAVVAFLVGAIVAGGIARSSVAANPGKTSPARAARVPNAGGAVALVNFADVVERINPAVVNIDATTRGRDQKRRRGRGSLPDPPEMFDGPLDFGTPRYHPHTPPPRARRGFPNHPPGSTL